MWCVIWKNDSNIYSMFCNVLFESEKKAIEFKDKQKSMRKRHDCRAVKYEYKYLFIFILYGKL